MSSNATASTSSKAVNTTSQPGNLAHSQAGTANVEAPAQKRVGNSGSFGAGLTTRSSHQPRNSQALRKQNKIKRARLVDDDTLAESAAMTSIHSRKGQQSITHLMNFSLPPRPYFHQQNRFSQSRHQRVYHAIDKARYVHANFRFIVKPDREYHTQAVDADVYLEWDSVIQVLASAETQLTNCPICLSNPVASRMAKCGHIFCLSCLMRYMHSTDDSQPLPEKRARWKKCPICEDSIYISETRPVRWFVSQGTSMLREGGDVLLKLLVRDLGSTLALPRDAGERLGIGGDIPWYHTAEVMDYARFMKGGEEYMISQYDEEVRALEIQEREDELMYGDDTSFVRKAIYAINEAKQRLKGIGNPPDEPTPASERKPPREPVVFETTEHVPDMYSLGQLSQSTSESSSGRSSHANQARDRTPITGASSVSAQEHLPECLAQLHLSNHSVTSPDPHAPKSTPSNAHVGSYYFYNAPPNFFLSPLDIRILKAAFGSFSSFPSTILPRVEHISTGHIIDNDFRKRAKYLAHLPYGCEVNFLECNWTDIIGPAVLSQFSSDIGRRQKKRREKEAREERDRLRAEKEEEDKRWAAARRKRPGFVEKSISESDFQPLAHPDSGFGGSLPDSEPIATTPPWGGGRTHSSFATLGTPGTSPEGPKTVWGTAAVPPSSPPLVAAAPDPSVPDDGWLQGWENDLLDNDDAVTMVESKARGSNAGKQKKKHKKITLMSTSNARRGA